MALPARSSRVSDTFADERIAAKLTLFDPKPRAGLARVNADLKQAGVPPSVRLHMVSAVADLGRVAHGTLPARLARHASWKTDERRTWD
jgi:hypothetical protein